MRDISNYDCPKKFCPNKPGPMCGPCMADEIERLRTALEEAEIYFGDEWPDKIRAMTRANEQTGVKEKSDVERG